jgi:tRNA pseudouridine55 synthase
VDGILLIDKPSNWTSHDVVAKVRGILRQAESQKLKAQSQDKKLSAKDFQPLASSPKVKVGHTGTLDPFATGLLILVVGSYTKRAAEFSKLDKTYEAEISLGATSTTGDIEGEIKTVDSRLETVDREEPSREAVETVLSQF